MGIRLDTKKRLLAILGTLTQPGVVTAAPNVPRGKQEYEGVVFYVVPGRTTSSALANTLTNAVTVWTVQVIGTQVGLGLTVSAEDRMLAVADDVAALLNGRRLLELNGQAMPFVAGAVLSADNGLQKVEYPVGSGLEYLAYSFELTVSYIVEGC